MTIGVKICGLRDPETVAASVRAGVDWIGFVFHPRSPRAVDADTAAALQLPVQGLVRVVGLFVAPSDDQVATVLDSVPLDVLQVYAGAERALDLRRRFGLPVWQALGIATTGDLPAATSLDGLVIEARAPTGADRPGGNGVSFDWTMAARWTAPAPWLLAGGLRPDNVAEAIRVSGAPAVDVSSGVESAPGVKDPSLIRRFVAAARSAG